MIVDGSALVAIVLREPGWERLVAKLAVEETAAVGTPTLVETVDRVLRLVEGAELEAEIGVRRA